MPVFGDFETVGEPVATTEDRSHVATVWRARKTGVDDGRSYAVKSYAPRRQTQAAASEEELERDGGLRFAEGIKDLRKASLQGGRCLMEIHDLGITPEGVWYVSDFYPRTLERFIALRGRVDAEGLRHIVGSVIVGCLALKRARGFSHGNLKTRNVFLVGAPRALRKTALQLGDPYPAGGEQLSHLEAGDRKVVGDLLKQTVEAQDLHAIGELILQLVEGRVIQRDDINYPVRESDAWNVLGKDAVRWREWCNRLLDPSLSLERLNLETLAREFRPNEVDSRRPWILAVLGIAGLITTAFFLVPRWLPGKIVRTVPTASPITYGQTLAEATLTGGVTAVPGNFAFAQPTLTPLAGTSEQRLTFTPTDTTKHKAISLLVKVMVNKATPRILSVPTAGTLRYGQSLKDSALTGGAGSTAGEFAFAVPTATPQAGTGEQKIEYIPSDTTDYNSATASVKVIVTKVTPRIRTMPTASEITYGQALASSILDGGAATNPFNEAPVSGRFEYLDSAQIPTVGSASVDVKFTPSDATDYDPVRLTVHLQVNEQPTKKSTPIISVPPTASAITYGQTLADSTLSGGEASTVGKFTFTTPSVAPPAGTAPQGVTFTPADLTNYTRGAAKVPVRVNKATPQVLTEPKAGTITYGQTLRDSGLSGGEASTAGAFAFTTPGVKPKVGTFSQNVTFTPADTNDFNPVTLNVSVPVNPYPVVITQAPTASAITYGQPLGSSALTGGAASTPGTFAWTAPTVQPKAGATFQSVTFTPADLTDYSAATTSVKVTVSKATPQITAEPTASVITNGQTLVKSVLNGGVATTAGTFGWSTPALQPQVGASEQNVTFTPQDDNDFNPATGRVAVTVLPTEPHPPLALFGMDFVWVKGVHGPGAYVEKTELSQGQFKANGGKTTQTSWRDGDDFPVNLTFNDALDFCNGLNKKESGGTFALPTREDFLIYSGADTAGSVNPPISSLTNLLRSLGANTRFFDPNATANKLGAVKDGQPNRFGLINVLGNAWEWCDNGVAGVPAGLSYASTGFGPSGRLFADRASPTPDKDVLGVRLLYLPASAAH